MPSAIIKVTPPSQTRTRAANFDRIARPYRLLEHLTLGTALSRTRTEHLHSLTAARTALILGDGDGRFLAALLRANPHLHATIVDSSRTMLHLLATRCAFATHRLTIAQADALNLLLPAPLGSPAFDLVTTHFFLDCFTDPELVQLIPAIRARLAPGALWVVSDFRIPPVGLIRLPARLLVRALYLAFRIVTGLRPTRLPDSARHLQEAGFVRLRTRHRLGGLLTAELWQLPETASRSLSPVK